MNAVFIKSATRVAELPENHKPQIAFVGRSNVGKSSLLNHLMNQKGLARVSATPGRTQLINVFEVDKKYTLIDLPGYGYAKASGAKRRGFSELIHEYLFQATNLCLVFLIIDARVGPTDLDRDMLTNLESAQIPFQIIVNKVDKLSRSEQSVLQRTLTTDYPSVSFIYHSSVTGDGKTELLHILSKQTLPISQLS